MCVNTLPPPHHRPPPPRQREVDKYIKRLKPEWDRQALMDGGSAGRDAAIAMDAAYLNREAQGIERAHLLADTVIGQADSALVTLNEDR